MVYFTFILIPAKFFRFYSVNLCDTPLTHIEVISRERILFTIEPLSTEQAVYVYVCFKRIQPDIVQ